MKPIYHLVARTRSSYRPFTERSHCIYLWGILQRAFPEIAAAVLMPNHLHLLATGEPKDLHLKLQQTVRVFSRNRFSGQNVWESVPEPNPIADPHHLLRHIRYVHLNPCRKELCSEPAEWE